MLPRPHRGERPGRQQRGLRYPLPPPLVRPAQNGTLQPPHLHDGDEPLPFPRLIGLTLEKVYWYLFPEAGLHRQNHHALDDARMAAKIWLKLEGGWKVD